ncbi:hypothetical protein ACYJ1Y_04885 [Natrialbaceae archaeon A-gly3]
MSSSSQGESEYSSSGQEESVYKTEFIPYINRWGRITSLLAVAFAFIPAFALLAVFEIMPPTGAIIGGFITVAITFGIIWFIEPISYYPVLGIPGTYMAFLSGNISNLRLPCAAAAQESADVEPGTPQGSIISTIAIAGSIFVNITILTIGVLALVPVFEALPEFGRRALESYLVPAIFGAIFAQFGRDYPKVAATGFCIALVMTLLWNFGFLAFLPGIPIYAVIAVSVFGTMYVAKLMWEHDMIE